MAEIRKLLILHRTADVQQSPTSIEDLDSEIEGHEALRDGFLTTITTLLAEMKRRRNELVPFARLPVEVRIRIFIETTQTATRKHELQRLALAGVSSVWRADVLAIAPLWTTVYASRSEYLDLVLARSKANMLDITVADPVVDEKIGNILAQHYPRFRSLVCGVVGPAPLFQALQAPAPLLKSLDLKPSQLHPAQATPEARLQIGGGPHLTKLHLSYAFLTNPGTIVLINLKKLTLENIPIMPQDLVEVLGRCPMLEKLRVAYSHLTRHPPPPMTPTTLILPNLRRFEIETCNRLLINSVVAPLQADKLSEFRVNCRYNKTNSEFLAALRKADMSASLPATVIRNARVDHVQVHWTGCGVGLSGYKRQHHVLLVDFTDTQWDAAMEVIQKFFPSGRLELPIELVLENAYCHSLIRLDQISTTNKITVSQWDALSDDGEYEDELAEFLLSLSKPQATEDGTLAWPLPKLRRIGFDLLPESESPSRGALAVLAHRRGDKGSDLALEYKEDDDLEGWAEVERPPELNIFEYVKV